MRSVIPAAAFLTFLALSSLPASADQSAQEAACIGEASRQLGMASFLIKVVEASQTPEDAIITLDLSGQFATCIVTSANEVLEVTTGDTRVISLAHDWQQECIAIAATMQGVPVTDVAVGENIGGQADILILGGQPMVCQIAPDGQALSVINR